MINKFNEFNIHEICKEYNIRNYTINNGLVDVDGDVDLSGKLFSFKNCFLDRLPLNFGRVTRHFDCGSNKLISLEGGPKEVGGDFYCYVNSLISLQGAPKEVGGNFYCHENNLISLEGAPKEIIGDFNCSFNNLTTLEGAPKQVGRGFYHNFNPLPKEILDFKDIKYILKWQDEYNIWRNGSLDLFRFQELIKDYDR